MPQGHIELRGVEVHNLQSVDLDIPLGKLTVFCGVSGSGKTSLALDTLYAEGQRRYIESFSAFARQFLERLEKPAAERIDHLPAAVAVTHDGASRSPRTTIGAATEIDDYLRLLFARIGRLVCLTCGQEVRRETPQSAAAHLSALPAGTRLMIGFARRIDGDEAAGLEELRAQGFTRVLIGERIVNLADEPPAKLVNDGIRTVPTSVIVDRLTAGGSSSQRLADSLETAFRQGGGECFALVENVADWLRESKGTRGASAPHIVDGKPFRRLQFTVDLRCTSCGREYQTPEPKSFSYTSPLGACPTCEGLGQVIDLDMELIVPEPHRSLRQGAITPWSTPEHEHYLQELFALAPEYGLPLDVPFHELSAEHVRLIREGVPQRSFGGLAGFFRSLEERKGKVQYRSLAARYQSPRPCPTCFGTRLKPEALAWRIGEKTIAQVTQLRIDEGSRFWQSLQLDEAEAKIAQFVREQIAARLAFLQSVGLEYLSLDRTLRTLSGGEAQRVALTATLGSSLVNMLYVLDEPSVGLHPRDVARLVAALARLRDRGNTVVVVEHEEAVIRAADQLVEIGPGAGENGGQITFQGTPGQMIADEKCLTGSFLARRRGISLPSERRKPNRGRIRLLNARGHNLTNLTVEFPLGVLCLVTGVSGAGKSSLVQETLYGALCRRKRKDCDKPLPHDDVVGDGQIDDVMLVDQAPIGRSPRSNPVTYIKAFDAIRAVFAETIDARTHNYSAGHFSFNVPGGRCDACEGDGYQKIDMQFLSDVFVKCPDCRGTRYRKEILAVRYRGLNIAEVLELTVREAFSFFRGQPKVQARLKQLIDVGLDYLRLGQPVSTLSAGEAQRLKLAGYLSEASRNRTLFLLDEPTTGLHFADVIKLLDCFDALLSVGHSLIVVEHNVQLMRSADYLIDLGPGAAEEGGRVVVAGTPEDVAACEASFTGQALRQSGLLDGDDENYQ
ncbi:MAG TPA: excinuclease ABC subunit UvrA [Pirellulaceae bacterium]|nr:excinuclease ABC subunit UvrA [Pirellulaceae bacterium]